MSLLHMLDAEAEADRDGGSAAGLELDWMLAGKGKPPVAFVASAPPTVASPSPNPAPWFPPPVTRPAARPTPAATPGRPAAAAATSSTLDQLIGIGGPVALRRDVMLEEAVPSAGGPGFALISIEVHPVAEVRARRGPQAADDLFRTLVDALRGSLRPSDRIYRSGTDELTLLLRGRGRGGGVQVRMELESALRVALARRGLPSVRLVAAPKGSGSATALPRSATAESQAAAAR
jgi:GGDEF domain-containing protein